MDDMLKFWRFLTVILIALSLGPALAHLYELPAKITFEGSLWLELLQRLYPPAFGPIGGFFEVAAVVAAVILALLVRRRRPALGWAAAGALCLVASHAAFWIWVAPVNAVMVPLTPDTLPAGWTALRDQWEYTHAARAILQLIGLAFVVWSLIAETPSTPERR